MRMWGRKKLFSAADNESSRPWLVQEDAMLKADGLRVPGDVQQ